MAGFLCILHLPRTVHFKTLVPEPQASPTQFGFHVYCHYFLLGHLLLSGYSHCLGCVPASFPRGSITMLLYWLSTEKLLPASLTPQAWWHLCIQVVHASLIAAVLTFQGLPPPYPPHVGKLPLVKYFHLPCFNSLAIRPLSGASVSALLLLLSWGRGGLLSHTLLQHQSLYTTAHMVRVWPPCQSHPVPAVCFMMMLSAVITVSGKTA